MAELIYNIKNIFSKEAESCLMDYDADKYHIAAYQRGYKWDSDESGAVTILLNDLKDAFMLFQKQERKEYYLQYITLKKNNKNRYLEVIDGQQRLTTLSILISIISLKLEKPENLADERLEYAIRNNFFTKHIYTKENLSKLLDLEWDNINGLTFQDEESINNQDVFYLFRAAKKINAFLSEFEKPDQLVSFYNFTLDNVKIIVNAVDHISSEKVFSNLNSNKVPLTEAELIKGLLLTKISRLPNEDGKKHFREIMEMRLFLGRQWDEITRWSNDPEINSFYFEKEEGMNSLLALVAIFYDYIPSKEDNSSDYPLFNFFHKLGNTEEVYRQILNTYLILNDWFSDNKIYNLLGFLFFAKGSDKKVEYFIKKMESNKSDLHRYLIEEVKALIPKNPEELFYANDQDKEMHRVLLALNVFTMGNKSRFNYYRFMDEKWTLEHIFPQTPEGKGQKLQDKDKNLIIEMLGGNISDEIKEILSKEERSKEEKEIYQIALKGIGSLNSIGNMCLLSDKDNISNGCGFFDEKRTNILSRIRKGSFVPKHTFEVFSKMVFDKNPDDFERWTNENISNHTKVIKDSINTLDFN